MSFSFSPDDDNEAMKRKIMVAITIHVFSAAFLLVATSLTIASNTLLCVPRSSLDANAEARLANIHARGARRPLVLALTALAVIGHVVSVIIGPVYFRPQWTAIAVLAAMFLCWAFWMPRLEVGNAQERQPLVLRPVGVEAEVEPENEERLFKHWRRWIGIVLLLLADGCILMPPFPR